MEKVHRFPEDFQQQALILASGLAWAVGKLEGLGEDAGYAEGVLDWWRHPQLVVNLDKAEGA